MANMTLLMYASDYDLLIVLCITSDKIKNESSIYSRGRTTNTFYPTPKKTSTGRMSAFALECKCHLSSDAGLALK